MGGQRAVACGPAVAGYGWLNAGHQKLWGSEKAAFWNGGGAGVKGFATPGGHRIGTGKARRVLRMVGGLPAQLRHPKRVMDCGW
jgi:hypothetical protein